MRLQSSKRIVRDLGTRGRDAGYQRRLAGIRKTNQSNIGDQFQLELQRSDFARLAVFVMTRRSIGRSRELRVASSTSSTARDNGALTHNRKIVKQLIGVRVGHQCSDRN